MSALVSGRGLVMEYDGHTVLDVDALDVRRGETLTLVGHNGSGKSTLLRVLGLLSRPTRGEVLLDGTPVSYGAREVLASRRRMAEVLQQPLLCRMSVYNNVALGLRFRRVPAREIRRRVNEWLERFRIGHLRDRHARNLSGGEAQRTSLARAFVLEPELLILDEPFSALDPPTRDALLADFQGVLSETHTTTLFATHDRAEALTLGDRVAVMSAGLIVQVGPPHEIFSRPVNQEIARFVGVENLLPGRVTGCDAGAVSVDVGIGELEVPGQFDVGVTVVACVRPEDVTLERGVAGEEPAQRNVLSGSVGRVVILDSQVRVTVDCGAPIAVLVTKSAFRELKLDVGAPARVRFSPATAHLIRGSGDGG